MMKRPQNSDSRWTTAQRESTNFGGTHGYIPTEHQKPFSAKPDVYELPLMHHHPGCNISKNSADRDYAPRRSSELFDQSLMTPEAHKCAEAIEYIADHLRGEDEFMKGMENCELDHIFSFPKTLNLHEIVLNITFKELINRGYLVSNGHEFYILFIAQPTDSFENELIN
ncbi:Acetylcholine receptor subunit beta-like 1 [Nymphon striatum]|nr:Acetylcholine receptor subunit beta-like 1 [Nymphon striatum]